MPELAGIAAVIGTIAQVGGSIIQGVAIKKQGEREAEAAEIEAAQLDSLAKEEVAAAQREGLEITRQTTLLESTQRAMAAASGAMATDPSSMDTALDIRTLGRYRRDIALFGGIQRGKGLRSQAEARRRAGRASLAGAGLAAAGTIFGGIGSAAYNAASFYQQFGGGQPVGGDPGYAGFYDPKPSGFG